MKHVKGPDFPTGAIIVGRSGIRDAYRTGRGRIVMRARAHIEELRGGKSAIIVTELPVRRAEGRRQRRDQEDRRPRPREGADRDLRPRRPQRPHRDADPDRAQARRDPAGRAQQALQAHRRCRRRSATTRSRSSTACRGRSRCSSCVTHYLDFQREIVTRRSQHELRQAERRAHILQGYLIALDNLDAVIALIRAAADTEEARSELMERFELSEIQASAILELRLAPPHRPRAQGGRGRVRRPPGADRRAARRCSRTRRRSTR